MRAGRLERKTFLKKHAVRPEGEIAVYDLLDHDAFSHETIPLYKIAQARASAKNGGHDVAPNPPYDFETQSDVLSWCSAVIGLSPTASALWKEALLQGWSVGISDLHSSGFHLDVPGKKLFLDHFSMTPSLLGRSAYFRNTILITFIRALRDIWHESREAPFETLYEPEDILMMERVRAADCDTVTMLAAWELRGAGHPDVWRHMIGSAEGDMAMVFAKFLEREPSAAFNGSALIHAFRQWYADDARVDGCDHQTLEILDDALLGDGTDKSAPFGSQSLSASALESLSLLPDGTRYLQGVCDVILQDPFFAGLRDEINQTHFFQIMYDMEVTMVNNVPFRDRALAHKLFPQGETSPAEYPEN